MQPGIGGNTVRRELRAVGWFVNGRPPEANPGLFEVFLGGGIGGGDAWRSDSWESNVLHARSGSDSVRLIHGCYGLRWNCEKVLSLEINVVEIEHTSILDGGRGNGWTNFWTEK